MRMGVRHPDSKWFAPPIGTQGRVVEISHEGALIEVEWAGVDNSKHVTLMYASELEGGDSDHCECRAPWWAFWNPHSRFGWMFFAFVGACVPGVIESLSAWVRSI